MDRLHHQLVEIHTIAAMQLAECARWRQSNPTPNMAHVGAGWRGPIVVPSTAKMAPPPSIDFSPQASLWQRGQHVEPQAHRHARQMGAQPECRAWNPRFSERSNRRRHCHDPKGLVMGVSRRGMCDVQLTPPFWAPIDILRCATKEM
jgi:hypothetical protein